MNIITNLLLLSSPLYFIEMLILFQIVSFIRCHCYYFYTHIWLDQLGLKSSLVIFMSIDNVTWHARVGIFYALKSLHKIKSNAKKFPVLTNPVLFSFIYFLNVIIFHCTTTQHVLDRVLTEKSAQSRLCLIMKLSKMVKTITFLTLCVSNLLMQCGDIEVNPGPKYSSLTFCH